MKENIDEFKRIASKRWQYLEKGDSKNGNICYNKLKEIVEKMKAQGELEELEILLNDADEGVQLEAASTLLLQNSSKAEEVLIKLSMKKGILPFTAKQTLKHCKVE